MKAMLSIFVLSALIFSPVIVSASDVDLSHFEWTSGRSDAELMCMEDALSSRVDVMNTQLEQVDAAEQRGESFVMPHAFTEAESREIERQNIMLRYLHLLTRIYIYPDSIPNTDQFLLHLSERGSINLDEFNILRADFNPPDNMPYFIASAAPTEWVWDFFKIAVSHTPTRAHVEFILEFLGITGNSVYIVVGDSLDYEEAQYAPEYQVNAEPLYSDGTIDIEPLSQVWSMGQRIFVSGLGHYTLGHPRNTTGESFFTALHSRNAPGANVFCAVTNAHIGIVVTSRDTSSEDVAEIRVLFGRVSTLGINRFRGEANIGDSVRSMRGVTGTVMTRVTHTSFNIGDLISKIIVEERPSTGGDSGAALIRTIDNTVLGTRRARCNRTGVGIYTNVTFYS